MNASSDIQCHLENPATNGSDLQPILEECEDEEDGAIALPPENDLEYSFSRQFTYEYQEYESKKNKSKFVLRMDFVI